MESIHRREFLRRGALAGIGLGLLPFSGAGGEATAEPPRVRRRVRLGRTGIEVPDIGFGSSRLAGSDDLVHPHQNVETEIAAIPAEISNILHHQFY